MSVRVALRWLGLASALLGALGLLGFARLGLAGSVALIAFGVALLAGASFQARRWDRSLRTFGAWMCLLAALVYVVPNKVIDAGSGQDAVWIGSTVMAAIALAVGAVSLLVGGALTLWRR